MSDENKNKEPFKIPRPEFPKRAVITGGMPYGNKKLHFEKSLSFFFLF